MHETVFLFDIDGTLLTTDGAGRRVMRRVASDLFGTEFSFEGVQFGGRLDPLIFADAAAQNGIDASQAHQDAFRDRYLGELGETLTRDDVPVRPMPGIPHVLKILRGTEGVVLGLLTGNFAAAAPLKLTAAGLDYRWFTLGAFGDEAPSRADLAALALSRYKDQRGRRADPTRVVVVGDTPSDVECARANGCVAFAVATGPYSLADLQQAGADVTVPDLSDPTPLLALIG